MARRRTPPADIVDDDATVVGSVAWVKDRFKDAAEQSREMRVQAKEDFAFYAGDQWSEEDRQKLEDAMRPIVTFNRVGVIVDAVGGAEINNRQEVRYIPREIGDSKVNEILTGGAKWVRDQCDAEDEESDAFLDLVISGLGATETLMSYEDDLDGEIKVERRDWIGELFWDPAARKRNLSDARYMFHVRDTDKDDVKAQWPDKWEQISGDGGPWSSEAEGTDPHETNPEQSYKDGSMPSDAELKKKGKLRVVQCQWWERRHVYRVKPPEPDSPIETLDLEKFQAIADAVGGESAMRAAGFRFVRLPQRRYMRIFVCGDVELERGEVPGNTGDNKPGFTFRFMTGKRDRNKSQWYGLVRAMKDPSRWSNKFFSSFQHIVSTNAKGGVMVEVDAVDKPKKFEEEYAQPDSVLWMKPGALANGKVQSKPAPPYPVGTERLMQFSIDAIRDTSGVNLEMLGMADRQQAGVLEYQRRQAGLTVLASFFDALRRYRKEQGRVLLSFMVEFISDGRLVRILGPDGAEEWVPLVRDPQTRKYDIIVDSAPTAPNEKERVFSILSSLLPTLGKIGALPPPDVLDYTPLPTSLVQKWKQQLQQSQKPQGPPPEVQAMQAKHAAEMEMRHAEAQFENERKNQETQAEIQRLNAKAAAEIQNLRERSAAEIEIKRNAAAFDAEMRAMKTAVANVNQVEQIA